MSGESVPKSIASTNTIEETNTKRRRTSPSLSGPKKFTEPGALSSSTPTDLRLPPTGLPERTRPNRVPCSVQRRHYGAGEGRSRPGGREVLANCGNEDAASVCGREPVIARPGITKHSPSRVRFRPPPRRTFGFRLRAYRRGLDLIASRARCKGDTTGWRRAGQERPRRNSAQFA